jgi:SAM-dependent methyltransferase
MLLLRKTTGYLGDRWTLRARNTTEKEMKNESLSDLLEQEQKATFFGWDFAHIANRMQEDPLPWNYKKIVEDSLGDELTVLDIDTGGGEFLSFVDGLPKRTFATEAYEPNIPIAKERLRRSGIVVSGVKKEQPLPFEDAFFDLIICRHGSFSVDEIHRILRPKGLFITQQVGSLNAADLNASLGDVTSLNQDWCMARVISDFETNGFDTILFKESVGKYRFYDVGAIVYYLKCVPWQVTGFSVEKYLSRLEILNRVIEKNGYIDFISHRFILILQQTNI